MPPPPRASDDTSPRNVLLVHVHPCKTSFSSAIADAVEHGAREGGHSVKRRSLCQEGFQSAMSETERLSYFGEDGTRFPSTVQREHLADLRWCDSVVFVYPTWWFNVPATLKGYFDRIFVPGSDGAWDFPRGKDVVASNGLSPRLTNIERVLGVSTYGASRHIVALAGDNGRNMIGTAIRANFAPDCTVAWLGLYDMDFAGLEKRKDFLENVKTFVRDKF